MRLVFVRVKVESVGNCSSGVNALCRCCGYCCGCGCECSAADARNVDGSPFRLNLRVREHDNQTDAHFDVLPIDLATVSAHCG
jgi:hypothetical protein